MTIFQKIILFIFAFIILNNCSINQSVKNFNNEKFEVVSNNERYNILLKYEVNKLIKRFRSIKNPYQINISINFEKNDSLSLRGLKPLNTMEGIAHFKIKDKSKRSVIYENSIVNKITYGSVGSVFNKDLSEKQIKIRLLKSLAPRIITRAKLAIYKNEDIP